MTTSKAETTQKGTTPEEVTREVQTAIDELFRITLSGFSSSEERTDAYNAARSQLVSLIRSEALGEAAKVCEDVATWPSRDDQAAWIQTAASRIRSLSSQSVSPAHQAGAPVAWEKVPLPIQEKVLAFCGATLTVQLHMRPSNADELWDAQEKAFAEMLEALRPLYTHPVPGPETMDAAAIVEECTQVCIRRAESIRKRADLQESRNPEAAQRKREYAGWVEGCADSIRHHFQTKDREPVTLVQSVSPEIDRDAPEGITDTQRLDWLDRQSFDLSRWQNDEDAAGKMWTGWQVYDMRSRFPVPATGDVYKTVREAIDAAMHSDTQRQEEK